MMKSLLAALLPRRRSNRFVRCRVGRAAEGSENPKNTKNPTNEDNEVDRIPRLGLRDFWRLKENTKSMDDCEEVD